MRMPKPNSVSTDDDGVVHAKDFVICEKFNYCELLSRNRDL